LVRTCARSNCPAANPEQVRVAAGEAAPGIDHALRHARPEQGGLAGVSFTSALPIASDCLSHSGDYAASWNAADQYGVRVARGVYFYLNGMPEQRNTQEAILVAR